MGVSIYVILMSILVGLFALAVSGLLIFGGIVIWKDRNRIPALFFFLVGVLLMFACADVIIRMYAV